MDPRNEAALRMPPETVKIDFTMTAMRRPEVLERTLWSFVEFLEGVDFGTSTLYINIDPEPDGRNNADVLKVAEAFFQLVVPRQPSKANFPDAVKWCWRQPKTKFFFHLEDDWVMLESMHIDSFTHRMAQNPGLAYVGLRAYPVEKFPVGNPRLYLSPGLYRTAHADVMSLRMNDYANPEMQLWQGAGQGFVGCQIPNRPVIRDIGRDWLLKHGYGRGHAGGNFIKWSKTNEPPPQPGPYPRFYARAGG